MGDYKGKMVKNGENKDLEPESPQSVKECAIKWWNTTIVGTAASYVLIVSHDAWIRILVQGLLEDKSIRAGLGVTVGRCRDTADGERSQGRVVYVVSQVPRVGPRTSA